MTRYSRSAIPGRSGMDESLDRKLFGERRPAPANDGDPLLETREPGPDFRLLPDEADGYRPPQESRRAPLILVGAFVTVAVFGVVVWNAYRGGVRPADAEVAPQIASVDSFKTKPAETFARPPMEKSQPAVFDAIESGARPPAAPAAAVVATPEPAPAPAEVREPAAAVQPPPQTVQQPAAGPAVADQQPLQSSQLATAPPPLNTPPPAVQTAAVQPAQPAPQPAAQPLSGGYKPAFSAGGNWLVQIGAPQTQEAAEQEWNRRAASWPELFQGAERVIVRADVNGRTVYRVRAGAFATQAEADAFCAAIKGRGGDCFRATR